MWDGTIGCGGFGLQLDDTREAIDILNPIVQGMERFIQKKRSSCTSQNSKHD
jgi:hypothetical protein